MTGQPAQKGSVAKAALLSLLGVGALGALYWRTAGVEQPRASTTTAAPNASTSAPADAGETPGHEILPAPLPEGYAWKLQPDRAHLRGPVMGTTFTVTVAGETSPIERERAAFMTRDALEGVNAEMSTYIPDSTLSRFNKLGAGDSARVSHNFAAVFRIAEQVYTASDGAFDPTVGPLVRAWGFGPDKRPETEPDIAALLPRLGFGELSLAAREPGSGGFTLTKARAEIELDFSAVAKGHAADLVCQALARAGHANLMVEVGGEVCVRGVSGEKGAWRVGVERPGDTQGKALGSGGIERVVSLGEPGAMAIATSGDYRNYYERDGKRLSHTIDPRTGRPIEHRLASVSVLAESAGVADAWATALNVLGPDAGHALAGELGLAAYFLVRDEAAVGGFAEFVTPGFAARSVAVPAGAAAGG